MMPRHVWIGWDVRELRAWNVAARSLVVRASVPVDVHAIMMPALTSQGLYYRPTQLRDNGGYWDEISQAPMSTGHAIARFLVPYLMGYDGLALFTDGDVLFRDDVEKLFALADSRYAVQVVKHQYAPLETLKMDGQEQTRYQRKNWSSVMLFHCGHPANRALSVNLVNTVPGRDLHRFCWLDDALIGGLPATFNWLVGHSSPLMDPAIVHFTSGVPDQSGYEHVEYADEWYARARACGYRLTRPAKVEALSA